MKGIKTGKKQPINLVHNNLNAIRKTCSNLRLTVRNTSFQESSVFYLKGLLHRFETNDVVEETTGSVPLSPSHSFILSSTETATRVFVPAKTAVISTTWKQASAAGKTAYFLLRFIFNLWFKLDMKMQQLTDRLSKRNFFPIR